MIEINDSDVLGRPEKHQIYLPDGEPICVVKLKKNEDTLRLEEGVEFTFRGEPFTVVDRDFAATTAAGLAVDQVIMLYYR